MIFFHSSSVGSNMAVESYLGPYSAALLITEDGLMQNTLPVLTKEQFTNGLVLEVRSFYNQRQRRKKNDWTNDSLVLWLRILANSEKTSRSNDEIYGCVETLFSKADNFRRRKLYNERKELESELFNIDKCICIARVSAKRKFESLEECRASESLKRIGHKIAVKKQELEVLKENVGHFNPDNVKKRDTTSQKAQSNLRKTTNSLNKANDELNQVNAQCAELEEQVRTLEESIQNKDEALQKAEVEKRKKIAAQKSSSYYRIKLDDVKEGKTDNETISILRKTIKTRNEQILELDHLLDLERENNHRNILLKDGDSYSTCIRECILGLAGLEIACEKISHAIVVVSNHLFNANFKLIDLPNSSTVRAIVDEGHYIAKR
jgi:hypothetical protein